MVFLLKYVFYLGTWCIILTIITSIEPQYITIMIHQCNIVCATLLSILYMYLVNRISKNTLLTDCLVFKKSINVSWLTFRFKMPKCCLGLAKLLLKSNLAATEVVWGTVGIDVPEELFVVLPSFIESWFKHLVGPEIIVLIYLFESFHFLHLKIYYHMIAYLHSYKHDW